MNFETKTSSTAPSFHTHVFPRPPEYHNKNPFQRSVRGCKIYKKNNSAFNDQLSGSSSFSRPTCNHNHVQLLNPRLCDACGLDLGNARHAQEQHLINIVKQEDGVLTRNQHARKLHGLGIHISALIEFAYAHDCWDWPTGMVVRDLIKPATKVNRCRYGDLSELKEFFGPGPTLRIFIVLTSNLQPQPRSITESSFV